VAWRAAEIPDYDVQRNEFDEVIIAGNKEVLCDLCIMAKGEGAKGEGAEGVYLRSIRL